MREAIRIRCGNHEADIYEYGASSKKISHTEARSKIIDLTERNALLDDVYHSGSLVSAFMQRASLDGDDARSLLSAVNRAGGPSESYAFQLLFNELRCSGKLKQGI